MTKPVVEFDRLQGWIDGPTLRAVVEGVKDHPFLGCQTEIRTSRVERIGYGTDGEIVEVETRNTIYRVRA